MRILFSKMMQQKCTFNFLSSPLIWICVNSCKINLLDHIVANKICANLVARIKLLLVRN